MSPPASCVVCGAGDWTRLPDPGPRSMASDLRVLAEPLGKAACRRCGLAVRVATSAAPPALFADAYTLYAHAPGSPFEQARQRLYASWIADAVPHPPRRVLDVGCGNGSLLLALAERWPDAELLGCDASSGSVGHGRAAGLQLWQGTSDTLDASVGADLVLAVNVIEHTADRSSFIRDLRRAGRADATVVVVCPDGSRPDVELLIADHLFSLAPSHLSHTFSAAGLGRHRAVPPPPSLRPFQMVVSTPGLGDPDVPAGVPPSTQNDQRRAFLDRWGALDSWLLSRMPGTVTVFGTGEAAGLLRAYAPAVWSRVGACTGDVPPGPSFAGIPFQPLHSLPAGTNILVAVQPAGEAAVAERLRRVFTTVITWRDLVL